MMFCTVTYWLAVFLISLSLCFLLIKFPLSRLQDKSGERSLHHGVIPRSGGVAIFISFMAGLVILSGYVQGLLSINLMIAVVLMCSVSLLDDVFSLPPLLRFLFQFLIAGFIVFFEKLFFTFGDMLPVLLCQCLTVLGLVWMINLYNFMDGMDGFASGMALIGFGTLGVLGYAQGDDEYACLNLLLVVSVSGFWYLNFPPARIFMGDMGSTLLGLLAGLFSLLGWQRGLFPLWVPAVLFSPFWVDATYTVIKRIYRGERFWLPHRSHFYQRLVLTGLGHKRVVLLEYALMIACALSILLPLWGGLGYNRLAPLVWIGVYGLGIVLLEAWLARSTSR